MNDDNDNVFRFGTVTGGKGTSEAAADDGIPTNKYVITDIDHEEYFAEGFLIFTSHHLAVMRDFGKGAVPILVLPINRVAASEICDPEEIG